MCPGVCLTQPSSPAGATSAKTSLHTGQVPARGTWEPSAAAAPPSRREGCGCHAAPGWVATGLDLPPGTRTRSPRTRVRWPAHRTGGGLQTPPTLRSQGRRWVTWVLRSHGDFQIVRDDRQTDTSTNDKRREELTTYECLFPFSNAVSRTCACAGYCCVTNSKLHNGHDVFDDDAELDRGQSAGRCARWSCRGHSHHMCARD